MQKVINLLAVLSFLGTASIIGGGAYVYLNRAELIENAKGQITKAATEAIAGALPGMINGAMPKLPSTTGGTIPGAGGGKSSLPAGIPGF